MNNETSLANRANDQRSAFIQDAYFSPLAFPLFVTSEIIPWDIRHDLEELGREKIETSTQEPYFSPLAFPFHPTYEIIAWGDMHVEEKRC